MGGEELGTKVLRERVSSDEGKGLMLGLNVVGLGVGVARKKEESRSVVMGKIMVESGPNVKIAELD